MAGNRSSDRKRHHGAARVDDVGELDEGVRGGDLVEVRSERVPVAGAARELLGPALGQTLERVGRLKVERLREQLDAERKLVEAIGGPREVAQPFGHALDYLAHLLEGEHHLVGGALLLSGCERDLACRARRVGERPAQVLDRRGGGASALEHLNDLLTTLFGRHDGRPDRPRKLVEQRSNRLDRFA